MSRHSELFDRVARESGFFGKPIYVKMHARSRTPILPIQGRTRSEIEKIVNRLSRGSGEEACKTVVITSIEQGGGSSWICAHTGDLLAASTDGSVCLVDANLNSPTLHDYMGVSNRCGLIDLLKDPALNVKQVATRLAGRDFWLIPGGSTPEDSECLAQSDRMRDRIAEIRSAFEYVLIDAPPVGLYNDALALGQLADGVLLVVRASSTRRDSACRLTAELLASGVKLIGAVLNDYASPIPEAIEKWL